jgi:hypothetical protein
MDPISKTVGETVKFKIAPTDADGNSRDVQDIKWQTSGDGTLTLSDDSLSAELVLSGTPGENVVTVSADADLTAGGVNALTESATVTSTAVPIPQADKLNLTAE